MLIEKTTQCKIRERTYCIIKQIMVLLLHGLFSSRDFPHYISHLLLVLNCCEDQSDLCINNDYLENLSHDRIFNFCEIKRCNICHSLSFSWEDNFKLIIPNPGNQLNVPLSRKRGKKRIHNITNIEKRWNLPSPKITNNSPFPWK